MDRSLDTHQEYDPTLTAATRVWVFCRECRCRLQVNLVPRPNLPFACLCGHGGTLAEFDVMEREERAKEVAELFEVAYQASKEILAPIMDFKKTRMFSGRFASLVQSVKGGGESEEQLTAHSPAAHESEAVYQAKLADLMATLDSAGAHPVARHGALNAIAEFTYERRHLRSASRAFCIRACESDHELLEALFETIRKTNPDARLRLPSFKFLVEIYKEAGDIKKALRIAKRAQLIGLPGFDQRIEALEALR
jgi:hypothetical protein